MVKGLPRGYKKHDGKSCPVEPDAFVDLIIRTKEGLGHSGPIRARLHDWEQKAPKGIGHIVGWRRVAGNETIDNRERWREK